MFAAAITFFGFLYGAQAQVGDTYIGPNGQGWVRTAQGVVQCSGEACYKLANDNAVDTTPVSL